jgi:hypothetical protein
MANGPPTRKAWFWPALFFGAFAAGALLWGIWMYKIVQRTRRQQENGFFAPQGSPALPATNSARP